MRRNWLKVFLLSLACVVCLHGNCFAWMQYYNDQHRYPEGIVYTAYYVDEKFVNVQEYNGRKYLELSIKSEICRTPYHMLLDVERNAAVDKNCIEIIERTGRNTAPPAYRALLQWAENKYPSLVNELREHNKNHPLPNETSNTGTAAGGAQGTGSIAIDGDWNFLQLLGDGPVQYRPRMSNAPLTPLAMDDSVHLYVGGLSKHEINIDNSIRQIKCDPSTNLYLLYGAYMYETTVGSRGPDVIREPRTGYPLMAIFEYDEENNAFILYGHDYDENNNIYYRPTWRLNIVDKNTVEESFVPTGDFYDDTVLRFQYMKSDRYNDEFGYQGYCWEMEIIAGEAAAMPIQGPVYEEKSHNEVGVDGLFAFLACKGKVGYAPDVVYTTRQF